MLERISFWDAVRLAMIADAALLAAALFYGQFRPRFHFHWGNRRQCLYVASCLPGLIAGWLCLTFCSIGLLALAGRDCAFETMFRVLLIAMLPAMGSWVLSPVRFLGRTAHHAWMAITVVGSAASFVWLWYLLQFGVHLPDWQAALVALPCAALLWSVERLLFEFRSSSLLTLCRWRRTDAKYNAFFCSHSRPESQAVELARRCDWIVEQVAAKLEVSLPSRPIGVFVFDTITNLRAAHRDSSNIAGGYAHEDCVAISDGEWEPMRTKLAHEFTHVLSGSAENDRRIGLLEEGLAEYIRTEIVAGNAAPPKLTVPIPLRFLAHNSVFFDCKTARETECTPADYYNHAHALVRYLIETYGLEKFKAFRREAGAKSKETRGEEFARVARKVYGIPLWELEYRWRRTYGCARPMWRNW